VKAGHEGQIEHDGDRGARPAGGSGVDGPAGPGGGAGPDGGAGSQGRDAVAADGQVVLRLRHPWADGTTHVTFEPTAFLERLAVLVPRPRINLLLYYGVLAAHAAWRAEVVARAPSGGAAPAARESDNAAATSPGPAGRRWADLMRRAFEVDVLACPRCGGRLRLVALLEAGPVTARILRHLGLPSEVPAARPARAPPLSSSDESW
jgi:hypothetical protein